ncbi:phenylalanine--tRNA ligase subunit alpha [Arcanobacterium haemolyticum]|uniref:Phenylalanine--tRNA ligase alpha subunit n=1 Tax=Arcanobacterium haemolyticum (strain ATCC 9345 / DSM 20595 / CCM 5947 / CCUG 17215 / LMG 16163 / NBRC 15585 / NCTC 8452 / 11018) TaxID=644284 RepID=D7BP30_ARCHD|nr:phenylalanine--tRNA ligase subunit alpha [Arcanobacterium haemolyticum]ADH92679.1 phenylalanyl-tRNA synthetase, alpha subunit [Arcanobacterium haemolyticum DSM 20595]QCX46789.1 phenylalanine--tRNA ligase subunit alpha [Arcanobacterium haemolyticum]SQH28584.1 Phenylalanine--tRNA ligase alpha subunit [Arcanobacterium haemolyticum]
MESLSPLDEAGIAAAVLAAKEAFANASSLDELKDARLAHSGDNAPITHANMQIKSLDKSERPIAGKLMGGARKEIQAALAEATERIEAAAEARMLVEETVDVTVPFRRTPRGARHPLPALMEDISDLFVGMGWQIAEGPELEHEWFNFDALNFGPDHPARQMQDTFYVKGVEKVGSGEEAAAQPGLVLRTHTSPVQSHSMLERGVPLYIVCPGKVFRTDALDATHTPVFHQIEGLAVDKGLTMEHLKGTLDHFARKLFGPDARTRLRPSYFPFTEPSAEMDLWFPQKKGGAGWIEWGGCGMVNPEVLRNAGIDPEEYTGFAFGMGIERTLMLRNAIADMRDMVEGDVRFSTQFGTTGRGN